MKKLFVPALAMMVLSVSAQAKPAEQDAPAVRAAIFATQLLTAQKCAKVANVDPNAIKTKSGAFAFLLAFETVANGGAALMKAPPFLDRVALMKCDSQGLLQLP